MSKVGFQDFWVAGSRLYFEPEDKDYTVDLGVIQTITPTIQVENLELKDADGGRRVLVDETLSDIVESYDLQVSNMNLDNMALLFLASDPEDFTQTQAIINNTHAVTAGRLAKVKDANGVALYNTKIAGVYADSGSFANHIVEVFTPTGNQFNLSGVHGDVTALYTAGKVVLTAGTDASKENIRAWTVASSSFGGGVTSVVVEETITVEDTSLTGTTTVVSSGGTVYTPGTDYDILSDERGLVRILSGGAISTGNVKIAGATLAMSGKRVIKPQALQGVRQGTGYLVFGRGNNADQSVRECTISITPNSANITADDFSSMTLTVKVLNEITSDDPAGRMLEFLGDVPDAS